MAFPSSLLHSSAILRRKCNQPKGPRVRFTTLPSLPYKELLKKIQVQYNMSRVYVGNLDERITERDLEDEFGRFGRLHYTWVARKPPGFAFVDFEDPRDADDAVRKLDGLNGWRVEISKKSFGARAPPGGGRGGFGGGGGGGRDMACYNCGEQGHLARDCRARGVPPMRGARSPPRYGRGRLRSRSPRRSFSPDRRRGRSPVDSRSPPPRRRRSPTPLSRSPVGRRSVSRSRSP